MTRLVEYGTLLVLLGAAWLAAVFWSDYSAEATQVILWAPLYAAVLAGGAGVVVLGWQLATFPDAAAAALDLKADVAQAQADLADRGFKEPRQQ